MYIMYVDESGDTGLGEGASDYFVLSGLVIHEGHWNRVLSSMAENRKEIYSRYGLATHFELHATKMVGRAKKSEHGLSRTDAVLLYRDFLRYEATLDYVRIINVVVDKRDKDESCDVFCLAWDRLINRFENTIRHKNFPSAWQEKPDGGSGFLIVDETNEEKLRTLVRGMRHHNAIPSIFGGFVPSGNLRAVVEDPMHKKSELSLPIQLCDANAYFLLQSIAPNSTVRRHKAKNYFYYLEPVLCKEACPSNPMGVVWA